MCYGYMGKQWRAKKESAETKLTIQKGAEEPIVARKSAEKAFSDYLAGLQRKLAGRKKQKESV